MIGVVTSLLFASELLSAALALAIAHQAVRSYQVSGKEHILGLPIGFSFLALSYIALGLSYVAPVIDEQASWGNVLAGSYGLAFLAMSYVLKERSEKSPRVGSLIPWLFSLLIIGMLIVLLAAVVPPIMVLPSYQVAEEFFRILNLILLGYILYEVHGALRRESESVSFGVLVAFTNLAAGQYSLLIWAIDRSFASFTFAHLFRLVGLIALSIIALRLRRR